MFLKILVVFGLLAFAFAGLAIRVIFIRKGEFHGTCATNNPMLKNEIGDCIICGHEPDDECDEADQEIRRFRFKNLKL